MSHPSSAPTGPDVTRRVVLRGAAVTGVAVPFLAACAADEKATDTPTDHSGASETNSSSGGGAGALASTADVAVGEGVILKEEKIVLTQPTEGEFKAFTAVCTHQGCVVASVADGKITCECHGSQFSVEDGSNVTGPSGSAAGSVADLEEIAIKVKGDQIVQA